MSRRIRPTLRAFRFCAVFALTAASLIGGLGISLSSVAGVNADAAVSGVQVLGWGFFEPDAISSDGTHVWVANDNGQLRDRAERFDGRAGPGHLRFELRVRQSRTPSPRTGPTSGWRTRGELGHRAERLDGRPGPGHLGLEYGSALLRHRLDGTDVWVANVTATR